MTNPFTHPESGGRRCVTVACHEWSLPRNSRGHGTCDARSSLSTRVARAFARMGGGSQRGIDEIRRDTLYAPSDYPSGPSLSPPSSPLLPATIASAFWWRPSSSPFLAANSRPPPTPLAFLVACLIEGMGWEGRWFYWSRVTTPLTLATPRPR